MEQKFIYYFLVVLMIILSVFGIQNIFSPSTLPHLQQSESISWRIHYIQIGEEIEQIYSFMQYLKIPSNQFLNRIMSFEHRLG